jgi:hypothetical protein
MAELALHGLRLVLAIGLRLGRRGFPLWPVVLRAAPRLVLVAEHRLGAVLGDVALVVGLLRMGTVAAVCLLQRRRRFNLLRQ